MDDGHRTYTDEEFADVLRTAAELARESEGSQQGSDGGLTLGDMRAIAEEAGLDPGLVERAVQLLPPRPGGPALSSFEGQGGRWYPTGMTQERAEHLLSLVRAAARQQGTGDATSAGLVWANGTGLVATIHNEGIGSRVQLSANRLIPPAVSAVSGVLSAFFAFENSNGTPGEEIVSIVIGLAVAIGLWGFLELRIKRRIERLKSAIDRAMLQMADPTAPSGDEDESASQSHSSPTDCG